MRAYRVAIWRSITLPQLFILKKKEITYKDAGKDKNW